MLVLMVVKVQNVSANGGKERFIMLKAFSLKLPSQEFFTAIAME